MQSTIKYQINQDKLILIVSVTYFRRNVTSTSIIFNAKPFRLVNRLITNILAESDGKNVYLVKKKQKSTYLTHNINTIQYKINLMTLQTKNKQYWKDILAGCVAAFCVSPTNAILDRSVIEFANGKASVQDGVKNGFRKLFTTPLSFFNSFKFRWMFFVYTATYTTNNLTDTETIIPFLPLNIQNLILTFVVNTTCGIAKDKAYAQHFGATAARAFPIKSLGLFFLRDLLTVASAFTFPPVMAKYMQEKWGYSERTSTTIAQLSCPFFVQLFVTPLHLLALDIYNRENQNFGNRLRHIGGQYVPAASMRMIRFLPAYGIGGIINRQTRRTLKQ